MKVIKNVQKTILAYTAELQESCNAECNSFQEFNFNK